MFILWRSFEIPSVFLYCLYIVCIGEVVVVYFSD